MMDRSARSKQDPPTKEFFVSASAGTDQQQDNAFTGYTIDTDGDDTWIITYLPSDFSELIALDVVVVGLADDASMTVAVDVAYCTNNEVDTLQTCGPAQFTLASVGTSQLREIDIRHLVVGGTANPIRANDYLGIHVERLAIFNDDTDLLIVGVKVRYR